MMICGALNGLSDYADLNELKVNITKTKIVVFSRGKIRNIPHFTLKGEVVEVGIRL